MIERELTAVPVVSGLLSALPEGPYRALMEYARIDSELTVQFFEVNVRSIEEELGIEAFAGLTVRCTASRFVL